MPKPQGVIAQWPVMPATPTGNPPAGHIFVYFKSTDGKLYSKSSGGVEALVAGGEGIDLETVVTIPDDQTITGAKRFTNSTVPHPPISTSPDASPPSNPQVNDLWVVPDASPSSSPGNFAVSSVNPGVGVGMWVQTGLGEDGTGFTFWIEDGT